jgi:hypothetical protein
MIKDYNNMNLLREKIKSFAPNTAEAVSADLDLVE